MKKLLFLLLLTIIGAAGFVLVMSRDDATVLVSTDLDTYAPLPDKGQESFQRLLGLSRASFEYTPLTESASTGNSTAYIRLLVHNRDAILANRNAAKILFPDLHQLAQYESIGDPTRNLDADTVSFGGLKNLAETICSYCELACFGKRQDKGLQELLDLETVLSRWNPHTRTLPHTMIVCALSQRISATVIRVRQALTKRERQTLDARFEQVVDYGTSVARSMYAEYCVMAAELDEMLAEGSGLTNAFLFKRNQTLNIYGSFITTQALAAVQGDLAAMAANGEALRKEAGRVHASNWSGWIYLRLALPDMSNMVRMAAQATELRRQARTALQQ